MMLYLGRKKNAFIDNVRFPDILCVFTLKKKDIPYMDTNFVTTIFKKAKYLGIEIFD